MKHKLIQTHANISCSSNNESIKQLANISSSTTLDTSLSLSLILQGVFLLSASVKFLKIIRFQKCLPNLHIFKHFWLSCIIGILLMQIIKKLPVCRWVTLLQPLTYNCKNSSFNLSWAESVFVVRWRYDLWTWDLSTAN